MLQDLAGNAEGVWRRERVELLLLRGGERPSHTATRSSRQRCRESMFAAARSCTAQEQSYFRDGSRRMGRVGRETGGGSWRENVLGLGWRGDLEVSAELLFDLVCRQACHQPRRHLTPIGALLKRIIVTRRHFPKGDESSWVHRSGASRADACDHPACDHTVRSVGV